MSLLDLEIDYLDSSENNTNASSLGNYIAEKYIEYGMLDGSNEDMDYINQYYLPEKFKF